MSHCVLNSTSSFIFLWEQNLFAAAFKGFLTRIFIWHLLSPFFSTLTTLYFCVLSWHIHTLLELSGSKSFLISEPTLKSSITIGPERSDSLSGADYLLSSVFFVSYQRLLEALFLVVYRLSFLACSVSDLSLTDESIK